MSDTSKSAAFWRSFPIFEEFDTETIAAIADIATHRKWPAGTVIFQRGDEGNYMLAIASGRVKLSLISPQGKELAIRHMEPGTILGEMAILDGEPRSADATTVTATEGYVLAKRDLLPIITTRPGTAETVIRFLCARIRETTERLETMALYDLDSRVARFFLATLRQIHGHELPDQANLQLSLSQTEIAAIVGCSRPKMNRALASLEDAGAITRRDGIVGCDIGRLVRIAEPLDD
ncbi:MAG: Crp/Fnr family transcriptional regulator [Rhizobiales bacterium 63-7]|uniref:Crp/Fnr family transcriptional regulator n=1 Tax=Rhizobium sp. YJ-22 TaxID=3037556 RepID=UPI00092AB723|nr:Crp/Fnr family transcriptional regulator [Rhizobium sp. YJ-22]MBN9031724.1 Crp/Fnr family transcriptional regulator [Hyphomicrobiales bacterium]MDG3575331.1 Crp/Fnr family transcriptional regulator [Rhizobium sp. YJ-22]OJU69351.1 MAG: Crp/Fnr family transcriptional regulator [Rhizobiales bacterium 63-7]